MARVRSPRSASSGAQGLRLSGTFQALHQANAAQRRERAAALIEQVREPIFETPASILHAFQKAGSRQPIHERAAGEERRPIDERAEGPAPRAPASA